MENKVREQYNQVAQIYDQRWNYYISHTLKFFKTWSNLKPSATVLDVACGTGEFEQLILADHPTQSMVGVDISEKMLAIAQEKLQSYPNVSFQLASASTLPFADSSFDVVVSANAFHYFDYPDVVLKEMKRVLKPEGHLIILDWCKDFWFCRVCDLILQRIDPAHKHCYTQSEFHKLFSESEFYIQQSTTVRFGLIWGLMAATATSH